MGLLLIPIESVTTSFVHLLLEKNGYAANPSPTKESLSLYLGKDKEKRIERLLLGVPISSS